MAQVRALSGGGVSQAKERVWREHIARQAAGGLSVRAYCAKHFLTEQSFYSWRRELARRDAAKSRAMSVGASGPGFVRINVRPEPPAAAATIQIVLNDQVRVLVPGGATREQLCDVLMAVGASLGARQPC
jgi:hypothetical protein